MASSMCNKQETVKDTSAQASRPLQRLSQEYMIPKCQTAGKWHENRPFQNGKLRETGDLNMT